MKFYLETERLLLRPFVQKDALFLYELNNDVDVMRYTGDVPFKSVDAAERFVEDYTTNNQSQWVQYGMGRLAVIHKESRSFLGWSGLKFQEENQVVDIGYRFMKKYWGKGFATESGKRVVAHAFEDHDLKMLIAHVHELNVGSQFVAERLGMHLKHRFLWDDREPARYYEISKETYESKNNNR
jgi:ribosomal-protein-alanine N-acetyltransferase